MKARRVVYVTTALCLFAAGLGIMMGTRALPSETAVINAGVALWIAETSGFAEECVGIPGEGQVWISVTCGDGNAGRTYLFDRSGARLGAPKEPKT